MENEKHSHARYFHFAVSGKMSPLTSVAEALAALKKTGYVWFDFVDPGREELEPLIQPLSLHDLAVEDCLDEDQVPKMEDYPDNTFIIFNRFNYYNKEFLINELNYFIGKNFLVSITHCRSGLKKNLAKLDSLISRDMTNLKKGPDFLLHIILDMIVDDKFAAIEAMQEELDDAEEKILDTPLNFKPETLLQLRKSLLILRKSLFHEREILVRLCRRDSPFITEKAIYPFRDVYDHLSKFFEALEMYREMVTSLMEMYLSMINNRMSQVANRTNRIVRRLTLINTIFMPLGLLAGIGGMSEWSMMTGPENWRLSFPLFILLMIVIGFLSWLVLKGLEAKDRRNADAGIED